MVSAVENVKGVAQQPINRLVKQALNPGVAKKLMQINYQLTIYNTIFCTLFQPSP